MGDTSIEWSEKVWNPVRGCDIYSEECTNCYAMRQAHRFAGPGGKYAGLTKLTKGGPVWVGAVRQQADQLGAPLQWKRGSLIFVNSMSDLFYGDLEDEERAERRGVPFKPVDPQFIKACFEVMAACPQHTFQILTKRPQRMFEVMALDLSLPPMPHVLIGSSVGNQRWAERRLAPMRSLADWGWRTWVSYEPALGLVDWQGWQFIRWLVAGVESGPGRRAAELAWFEAARVWAGTHGIPFFMKQLAGAKGLLPFDEFPAHLRVRQYPVLPQ